MWSQVPAVQVLSYRVLQTCSSERWAQDLLDMIFLEDDLMAWATSNSASDEDKVRVLDSNGTEIFAGDSVHLIKDLVVKGANFTAKRG